MTTEINVEDLSATLLREGKRHQQACMTAALAGARKFQALLVQRTDDLGITDQGMLKNSWKAERTEWGAIVYSDCPYAGIIELGARPHPVSIEGQIGIRAWAIRKLGVPEEEADSVTFLICRKIRLEGQEPKYLVAGVVGKAHDYYYEELDRIMRERGIN